jgi:hypothetical protein
LGRKYWYEAVYQEFQGAFSLTILAFGYKNYLDGQLLMEERRSARLDANQEFWRGG